MRTSLYEAEGFVGMRRAARRRLPRIVFDFVDGGAGRETTLRENAEAFDRVTFRPRAAQGFEKRNLATTVLGFPLAAPVMIAPCGCARLVDPSGEHALAQAAHAAGLEYIFPHVGGYAIGDLPAAIRPRWYQFYKFGSQDASEAALDRAQAAGCTVLVLTVDGGGRPNHRRALRNGLPDLFGLSTLRRVRHLPQLLARPRWLAAYVAAGLPGGSPNVLNAAGLPSSLRDMSSGQGPRSTRILWSDVPWIRARWTGPIVIKGLLRVDDARRAVDVGAKAIVVSNHGGRQVDGTVPALQALLSIAAAVGRDVEVLFDGGVEEPTDVLKACGLGARAVLIGKLSLWALAAGGPRGVADMLSALHQGLDRAVALLGVASPHDLTADDLDIPAAWHAGA